MDLVEHLSKQANEETFGAHFEPICIAGIGFFGVVLYAFTKADFQIERTNLISELAEYDSKRGLQNVRAVKVCRPRCPSGIRDNARRLIAEIEAMKRVWKHMKEPIRYYFPELYEYNTSDMP